MKTYYECTERVDARDFDGMDWAVKNEIRDSPKSIWHHIHIIFSNNTIMTKGSWLRLTYCSVIFNILYQLFAFTQLLLSYMILFFDVLFGTGYFFFRVGRRNIFLVHVEGINFLHRSLIWRVLIVTHWIMPFEQKNLNINRLSNIE